MWYRAQCMLDGLVYARRAGILEQRVRINNFYIAMIKSERIKDETITVTIFDLKR